MERPISSISAKVTERAISDSTVTRRMPQRWLNQPTNWAPTTAPPNRKLMAGCNSPRLQPNAFCNGITSAPKA